MAHTSLLKNYLPFHLPSRQSLWLASLVVLPYAMYGSLLVMSYLLLSAIALRGQKIWRLCGQAGFGWLTAGLLLSASFALNRGEAFLQLSHFLPFFVLWAVFATNPQVIDRPFKRLETVARWLVLSAIPLCVIALIEYGLKFESLIAQVKTWPLPLWLPGWLYEEPYFGHRARSLFDHPNSLSAYLVIVFGLGLGLLLKTIGDSPQPAQRRQRFSLGIATALCLISIFCTGSRNGVLIALVLVAIALYSARRYKWAWLAGIIGSSAVSFAVLSFGIGGRSLSLSIFTNDPRVGVWRLAIEMIRQRPWLGWGLSGLRELYIPDSIPGYDVIYHAHNIWLLLASEAGIPVAVGFCLVFGTIIYRAVRLLLRRSNRLLASEKAILFTYLLAFLACVLFSVFDVVYFDARLNVAAWGLLAAIYAMSVSD